MTQVNRIIFFLGYPLSQRDYKRFGFETLAENGFLVEAWNLLPVFNKNFNAAHAGEVFEFKGCQVFRNMKQFEGAMASLSGSDLVIFMIGYTYSSKKIYQVFSRFGVDYAVIRSNVSPGFQVPTVSLGVVERLLSLFSWENLKYYGRLSLWQDYFLSKSPFKFSGIRPAKYILAGGADSYHEGSWLTDETTEILWLHSMDYDIFLSALQPEKESDRKRTAVFLDEYYPFHPDYAYGNSSSPVSADRYYPQMCRFFEDLEERFSLTVVIAAHPRSEYEKHPDYFEGRRVVRGKTIELVRDSELVLTHASTAVSFPVLFRKPLMFITDGEQSESRYGDAVKSLAGIFNRTAINLSERWDLDQSLFEFDNSIYERYEEKYIKRHVSEKRPFWVLFSDKLKKGLGS